MMLGQTEVLTDIGTYMVAVTTENKVFFNFSVDVSYEKIFS